MNGPIRQFAFVVPDIDAAIRYWVDELGVGPFYLLSRSTVEIEYHGEPAEILLSLALANLGPVQIELLQQHDDVPSVLTEFTQAGRTGLHHVAYWTSSFDDQLQRWRRAGREVVQTANPGGGSNRNCFVRSGDPSLHAIEPSEVSGPKGELFRRIARDAERWDGSSPIRSLSGLRPPADGASTSALLPSKRPPGSETGRPL